MTPTPEIALGPVGQIGRHVTDIHAAHAALAARGAVFADAPHMIHRHADGMEKWMNFLEDNEGRPLAIMAQVRI